MYYRHSVKYRGLFIFLSKNINTFNCNNSKLCSILLYVLCKTEQKATDLIKYKHKTFVDYFCIYRELHYNEISVIENNTFNNLPSLQSL